MNERMTTNWHRCTSCGKACDVRVAAAASWPDQFVSLCCNARAMVASSRTPKATGE